MAREHFLVDWNALVEKLMEVWRVPRVQTPINASGGSELSVLVHQRPNELPNNYTVKR